jgi:hypothetical protein
MDNPTRRSTKRIVIGATVGAVGAAINAARWMHSPHVDAHLWARSSIVLCALSVLIIIFRILYYRNRRDCFAEEMDHRRSLAEGSQS